MTEFVAYYRVSTRAQGASGLGLDSQREAVRNFVAARGGELISEFTEIESGACRTRPQLDAALARCASGRRPTLVIARLDRLARNVYFVSRLLETGVSFVAVDCPEANKMTIQILSVIAEYERDLISQRTRSALAATRARGKRLGNPRILAVQPDAVLRIKEDADLRALEVGKKLNQLQRKGVTSFAQQALHLNLLKYPTARGGQWTATSVRNVRHRLASMNEASIA